MSIIAAKRMKEMTILSIPQAPPVARYKTKLMTDIRIAPISKPNAATASPLKFPLDRKAIKAIKPNVPDVMPKAIAKTLQSIKMVNDDNNAPINTV